MKIFRKKPEITEESERKEETIQFAEVPFGEKVKRLREEKGLTQQKLAEKLYVTRQAVSRWECGARQPDLLTAKKLSKILGVSLDELLSGEKLREDIEREPVSARPADHMIQTALYAGVAVIWLLLCLFSAYAAGPGGAPSHMPAERITLLYAVSDLVRIFCFAAALLGYQAYVWKKRRRAGILLPAPDPVDQAFCVHPPV